MTASDLPELASSEFRKKYHVIAKLGEGGMALVHLAVVRGVVGVRKLVVLKSVRPELVADSNARTMFVAEARLAATLSHPNIVQTFEVVVSKGRPILVMEYLDGQPFSRIVRHDREERSPLALQLYVLKEVLSGLEYVHNLSDLDGTPLNLVHRDMSPQNVFVTYDGQVKILDFGIAKVVGSTGHTETGEIKGKIRYMAPEQMLGSAHLDRRADIFSVGVMLWEALTRRRLWEGRADVQVIQSVVGGGVPAPSTVADDVPPVLDEICRRALAHDVEQRYESAAVMQADLEHAIEQLSSRISTRQVGRIVAESFSEVRQSVKTIIEGQLRDEKASPINLIVENDGVLAEEAALSGDLWGLPSAVSVGQVTRRRRRTASLTAGSVLALTVAAGSLFAFRHFHSPASVQESPRPEESALAAPEPIAPPVVPVSALPVDPRSVHVQISAEPLHAKIFLDGAPLAGDPFSGDMKADSLEHTVRVEAPGYRPQTITVTLDHPLDTKVKLDPIPVWQSAPAKLAVHPVASTTAAPSTSVSSATSHLCVLPYYIDEQGIRRVRPECLK
jgi:serine/threonine-protein kinase